VLALQGPLLLEVRSGLLVVEALEVRLAPWLFSLPMLARLVHLETCFFKVVQRNPGTVAFFCW